MFEKKIVLEESLIEFLQECFDEFLKETLEVFLEESEEEFKASPRMLYRRNPMEECWEEFANDIP